MTINQMATMSNAYRYMNLNNVLASKAVRSISSGYRINSAADDAAGLAISEKMRGQISGLGKAYENAQAGVSLVQTADGALQGTQDILTRMKELATQASNGTYSDSDRALINQEFQSLKGELDRIAGSTHYNGINLLDGTLGGVEGARGVEAMGIDSIDNTGPDAGELRLSIADDGGGTWSITAEFGGETITQQVNAGDTTAQFSFANNTIDVNLTNSVSELKEGTVSGVEVAANAPAADLSGALSVASDATLDLQVGANSGAANVIGVGIADMSSSGLGLDGVDITTQSGAMNAIAALEQATNTVSGQRGSLGALEQRLGHTMNNLAVSRQNLVASESNIRDADIAKSMMEFTQRRIQAQASQAMMVQGMNLSQQMMLGLLMR